MARPKLKQSEDRSAILYERDFYRWCFEEADKLRLRKFFDSDVPNLVEELQDMGQSQHRELSSRYRLVLMHLLKWQFQRSRRNRSWSNTIGRERDTIEEFEERSPTLRAQAAEIVAHQYPKALRAAARETALPIATFPVICPYGLADIRTHDWLPD